jgi:hypothetical protein
MTKFQLLSCDVALAGDILNVVARHAFNPVTYPELLVLRYLHGENAITNIFDVGHVERDEDDEFKRLMETYGGETVREKIFPGAGARLPNGDNRYKPRIEGTKANPAPAPVPDAPLPDATVAPAGASSSPVDYGTSAPGSDYVPSDAPAPPADEAPATRASRRPIPVADGAAS